ncbi:DUF551 domain-containing protein [Escherichia coli]|uniref:DUF551 domain-containing protein n=1 Tax=Escherichia coli TaxID=562 RepID=UPI0021B2E982|nr:DUF551 domain-containing protein [Escherichia coli]
MTTITKERLLTIRQWRETYGPGSNVVLPAEEAEELARIALASLEAEPVAWMCDDEDGREYNGHNEFSYGRRGIPLYAVPPAPVLPHEWRLSNAQAFIERYSPPSVEEAALFAWNSCRAAMLQGSQPVSQTYKFPVNTPCQDAPAHIWLQTAGVWPEDGELSELTWCSHNQHHDDTLYVRADLVNGNSPVTPDGWISCSERMPDKLIPVMVMYEDGEMWSAMWNGNRWDDGTEYPDPHSVTHWREMPAAPQQEVNRG